MTNEDLVLAIQTGAGDRQELLYVLFKQNTGMIERIIQRCHCSEDPADLRQESFFGLTRAVDLWDPDKEVTFITYACYWIKQALYRYLENCGSVLRVPTHRRQSIREYYRAVRSFQNSLGRAPTEREIGAALGMKPEEIQAIKKDAQALTIRSTAEPIGEDGDVQPNARQSRLAVDAARDGGADPAHPRALLDFQCRLPQHVRHQPLL